MGNQRRCNWLNREYCREKESGSFYHPWEGAAPEVGKLEDTERVQVFLYRDWLPQ